MSIEFAAAAEMKLVDESVVRIKRYIQDHSNYRVVRDSPLEFGVAPIASEGTARILETITLSMRPTQVYVAFHAATRPERESFIHCVVNALAQAGIVCEFEEL